MTLGQKIQTLRHDAGLSQEGLGEKLGVSRQAISKWEADGAVPEVDKLIALSRLFEVNLHDLLQVEGTSREEPEDSEEQDPPAQPPEEEPKSPEEKDEPPRRNGRWWKALCVVLAVAVCAQGVALFRMNERLEDALTGQAATIQQLEELTDNLAGQLSSLGSRISQLEQADGSQNEQTESELDPTLPLVSDVEFTIETTEYGTRALKLSLVPAQSTSRGLHFEITCPGGTARSHPASQPEDSSAYTLSMICTEEELSGGFTVSAVFLDKRDRQYTQPLVRFSDITAYSWKAEELWEE